MTSSSATKKCKRCGNEKSVEEFYRNPNTADGYTVDCKHCDNLRRALAKITRPRRPKTPEQIRRNAEATRRSTYKTKYGIRVEDFDATVIHQNGICPICMIAPSEGLRVDFANGVVRGAVCRVCKSSLKAWEGRDVDLIEATTSDPLILNIIAYLRNPTGLRKVEDVQHEGRGTC